MNINCLRYGCLPAAKCGEGRPMGCFGPLSKDRSMKTIWSLQINSGWTWGKFKNEFYTKDGKSVGIFHGSSFGFVSFTCLKPTDKHINLRFNLSSASYKGHGLPYSKQSDREIK